MIIPVELEEVRLIEAKPVSNLGKRGSWLGVLAEQIEKDYCLREVPEILGIWWLTEWGR